MDKKPDYSQGYQFNSEGYNYSYDSTYTTKTTPVDLSAVMTRTFLFMFIALLVSCGAAIFTITTPLMNFIFSSKNIFMGLLFVEIGVVMGASVCINKKMIGAGGGLFLLYSILNGITLSSIFFIYELNSIATILAMTAVVFGLMAAYGYFTKADLTGIGSIAIMAIIGGIIVGLLNIFLFKNDSLSTILCVVTLAAFIGLTAYDTQKIKRLAAESPELGINTIALFGALNLYLDFINIFLKLLYLFGKRR